MEAVSPTPPSTLNHQPYGRWERRCGKLGRGCPGWGSLTSRTLPRLLGAGKQPGSSPHPSRGETTLSGMGLAAGKKQGPPSSASSARPLGPSGFENSHNMRTPTDRVRTKS